ncbi:MAG: hypothetical protein WCV90_00495 [Candidatus Woesearchaeota archaeon]|jgi:hypothetical protein
MQPLDTLVDQYDKGVRFTFYFIRRPTADDLKSLWLPEGTIFHGLIDANYIDTKGTVLIPFSLKEVGASPTDQGIFKVVFDYYQKTN